jgi:hypothetical protein
MDPEQPQSQNSPSAETPGASGSPTVVLEPTTVTVPDHAPWYKRMFGGGNRTKNVWRLSFVAIVLIGVVAALRGFQQPTQTTTNAGLSKARIALLPEDVHMTQDGAVQLWITSEATVTKAEFRVSFDPSKVSLSSVRAPNGSAVVSSISINNLDEANKNGVLIVTLGPLTDPAAAPTGTFNLVNISFRRNTAAQGTTIVQLQTSDTMLYHDDAPFVITGATASTLSLE